MFAYVSKMFAENHHIDSEFKDLFFDFTRRFCQCFDEKRSFERKLRNVRREGSIEQNSK